METLITFEILAFFFLAMGMVPFGAAKTSTNTPLVNKILFIFVSAILFFSLGLTSAQYDYNYCYVNETTSYFELNQTKSQATCDSYVIENVEVAYINFGMGILALLVGVVAFLIAVSSKNDDLNNDL
jgi:hypothetical protein